MVFSFRFQFLHRAKLKLLLPFDTPPNKLLRKNLRTFALQLHGITIPRFLSYSLQDVCRHGRGGAGRGGGGPADQPPHRGLRGHGEGAGVAAARCEEPAPAAGASAAAPATVWAFQTSTSIVSCWYWNLSETHVR